MDTVVSWLGGEAKTVAFAILSGVVGFLAKGAYDLWTARRKDRLERINDQLRMLYGPLYSLNQASNLAWGAFRTRGRTRRFLLAILLLPKKNWRLGDAGW